MLWVLAFLGIYENFLDDDFNDYLKVRVWNINAGTCLKVLKEHDNFARCISFSGNR